MNSERKPIEKRPYLRAGCQECKRRKIKCNEAHPVCGNCMRVGKPCEFPSPNHKNKPRRTRPSAASAEWAPPSLGGFEDFDQFLFANVFDDANSLVHGLADFETDAQSLKPFHSNIILNDPPEQILFDESELQAYLDNTDILKHPQLARLWLGTLGPHRKSVEQLVTDIITHYQLSPVEQQHLEDFAIGASLLYFFPFAPATDNRVMCVLLEYLLVFKYLLYAMLAVSASCMFTTTRVDTHDKNQKRFTQVCTRLLVAAFDELENLAAAVWHIEGLILTVLLLTMLYLDMSFVDTTQAPVLWISHLGRARLLLVKYDSLKTHNRLDSLGIVIAKQLFFCYDWSTKMSLPVNLSEQAVRNFWLETVDDEKFAHAGPLVDSLNQLRVLVPVQDGGSGFNLLTTLTGDVVQIVKEISTTICDLQGSPGPYQASPESLCSIMAAISRASKQEVVPGISALEQCAIPLSNPAHPLYQKAGRIQLPECAYGRDIDVAEDTCYSWCDVTLRLHVYFLYLKILTSRGLLHLPRSHPLIKSLVRKTMALMFFLKPKLAPGYKPQRALVESDSHYLPACLFSHKTIMIQFVFRLCIELVDDAVDFDKLELFFLGLIKLGCGNCARALSKVEENRVKLVERAKARKSDNPDMDYQTEIYDIF